MIGTPVNMQIQFRHQVGGGLDALCGYVNNHYNMYYNVYDYIIVVNIIMIIVTILARAWSQLTRKMFIQ